MKVSVNPEADAVTLIVWDVLAPASEEFGGNMIVNFHQRGEIIGIEVLRASEAIGDIENVELDQLG